MKKVMIHSVCALVLVNMAATAWTSRSIAVDSVALHGLKAGCVGWCDFVASCASCTQASDSTWIMCTNSGATFIDSGPYEYPDDGIPCGTPTAWSDVCGNYVECFSPTGCTNCVVTGSCEACSEVSGYDPCD